MEPKLLTKYRQIAVNLYKKYPNISDEALSYHLRKDLKAGFDPNQARNSDGTWGNNAPRITVYRGRGNNYAVGDNDGFLWVAKEKSTALNYAALDKDGNWIIDEFEIDQPMRPFKFPYARPSQYVVGENVANIFRQYLHRKVKAKEITIDNWRVLNEKIKVFQKAAGDNVEPLLTKLNKPEAAKMAADIIISLGFDALEVGEHGFVTYGIPKTTKSKLINTETKAGFQESQTRDSQGRWTDTWGAMKKYEQEIKGNDFESSGVYDKDGKLIFKKEGGGSYVFFTDKQKDLMSDAVLTHNHPGMSSFSHSDINFLFSTGLTDIRVINSAGDIFVMNKAADYGDIFAKFGRNAIQLINQAHREVSEKVKATTEEFILKYTDKAASGEISSDKLFQIIGALSANESHATWEGVSKTEFGQFALKYTKE